MLKKILYWRFVTKFLKIVLGLFYKKEYLTGYYFDVDRLGWYWAVRSLRGRILGENRRVPWPVHPRSLVNGPQNIFFDVSSINVFQVPGQYWQAIDATITVGKNCHVAPNVGVITTNHDIRNPDKHMPGKPIVISDHCWIGMNAMILSGVTLGPHTVVAAGAVVTKSFEEGYCVVGGTPAKLLKRIDPSEIED